MLLHRPVHESFYTSYHSLPIAYSHFRHFIQEQELNVRPGSLFTLPNPKQSKLKSLPLITKKLLKQSLELAPLHLPCAKHNFKSLNDEEYFYFHKNQINLKLETED
jgi:hypothetical protein